jgi:hypothetical protein
MQNEESSGASAAEGVETFAPAPAPRGKSSMFGRLKGSNKYETAENYSMSGVVFGALVFGLGILLTAIDPKGIPAILTMMGALVSFLSSIVLVFVWFFKETFFEKE